jgi:hypothetical protein
MAEREYEYQLKSGRQFAYAALMGAGALLLAYEALTNDRGLILYIIPLSKNAATIFYAVFAVLAGLASASTAVNAARRASLRQRIALTKDGLMVPKSSMSLEEELIAYGSVLDIKEFTEPNNVAVIRHRQGEFTLQLDLLPDERAYAEIVHDLTLQVQAVKTGGAMPPAKAEQPKAL